MGVSNLVLTRYDAAAAARSDQWVAACGGAEAPIETRAGRWLYVWNPALNRHAWLNLGHRRDPVGVAELGHRMKVRGNCYVTSEALYHLPGGKASGWKPMTVRHEGAVHW